MIRDEKNSMQETNTKHAGTKELASYFADSWTLNVTILLNVC
jgi:hypothetical protein